MAVITNGSAVLGLGNIGALAGKPVMEGKGCLFKKFAGIDVFDIEIGESDPDKIVDVVAALEPTFGGINLEDIKAPECFYIEKKLRERMKIPVFHDDQHGTAIVAAAAVLNGLKIVGKDIGKVKLVCSGAGAAAIACLDLQVSLGLDRKNISILDSKGVVSTQARRQGRRRARRATRRTPTRKTLDDVIGGCDVFLGLSGPGVLTPEMVKKMAERADHPRDGQSGAGDPSRARQAGAPRLPHRHRPLRLSEPGQQLAVLPVHLPRRARLRRDQDQRGDEARGDARARGARARRAVRHRRAGVRRGHAAVRPRLPHPARVRSAAHHQHGAGGRQGGDGQRRGDAADQGLRRLSRAARALRLRVRRARWSRCSPRPSDRPSASRMRKARTSACCARRRRWSTKASRGPCWSAASTSSQSRIQKLGLRLTLGGDCDGVNILDDPRYRDYWSEYYRLARRKGVTRRQAQEDMRTRPTLVAAMLVHRGDADAMLCGTGSNSQAHLRYIRQVIGLREGAKTMAVMQMLILPGRQLFVCDTHVNRDPTAEEIAEMTLLAAEEVQRFGIKPRVALLSHSSFGSSDAPSAVKMREALAMILERAPGLPVEGEMRADSALSKTIRDQEFPDSRLTEDANLLIMPNVDAANITYNALRVTAGGGITVGGILLGAAKAVHIMTPSSTVRRIVNMTAVAVADAGAQRGKQWTLD